MIKDAAPSLFFAICEVTVHAFRIDVGLETRGYGCCTSRYFLLKLNYFIVFYRRQRRSLSSRHRSRSPTPRRRKSRSPTPKRNKRQRKRSTSSSPLSASPRTDTKEMKDATEKLKTEEEEKKRYNYYNYDLLPFMFTSLHDFKDCGDVVCSWV